MERDVLISLAVAVLAVIIASATLFQVFSLSSQIQGLTADIESLKGKIETLESDVAELKGEAEERAQLEKIRNAILAEGAEVVVMSWGYGGLWEAKFKDAFAEYTSKKYGVPIRLTWIEHYIEHIDELRLAGKTLADICDVIEAEEDSWFAESKLGWFDVIDKKEYVDMGLLDNFLKVPDYQKVPHPEGGTMGVACQGFEWLGIIVRRDKVDPSKIKSWIDLSNPEFRGRVITYSVAEVRGQMIFLGITKALIDKKLIEGSYTLPFKTDKQTLINAMKWYKENIYPNIHSYVGTGEMRTLMQSGDAWICCTWGVYSREIAGSDWALEGKLVEIIYPEGEWYPMDRTYLAIAKGAKHPVCARILLDWMLSIEFQLAGWYKDPQTGKEVNKFGLTKRQFLVTCTGGVNPEYRKYMPDWAKEFYPDDPMKYAFSVDWDWYWQTREWIWETFQEIVLGGGG